MNKTFSRIFEIGCSGLIGTIIGTLLTIGYQHFFAPSQSFTFYYNGEEMIISESTYTELIEENKMLSIELNKAKQDIENLKLQISQNATSNENSEAVSTTNRDIQYTDITTLLFDSIKFNNELKTYKDTYGNIFGKALIFSNNGSVVYNLNSKYNTLEFTVANSENMASDKKCVIQFFGDGKLIYSTGFINYNFEPQNIELNVANINKLKIQHYYTYDASYNVSAGDSIIANINLSNKNIEGYDNIYTYQTKYMLEELRLFNGSDIISNPLILDTYGNQYECVYCFSNNSSSELLLNGDYSTFKGKIVPSELMNPEKECQIEISTDTNSQIFNIDYYTEPIDFEIDLFGSKFLIIKHFYEYDWGMNATAGDAMIVNCSIIK